LRIFFAFFLLPLLLSSSWFRPSLHIFSWLSVPPSIPIYSITLFS
jgi:hypothetical protein